MAAAESPSMAPKRPRRVRTGGPQNGDFGVNGSLTPRTERETADVAGAAARMLRALARRAEAGDLQALTHLEALSKLLQDEQLRAAHGLNLAAGYSWGEIGRACGITRQAAHQRWGAR